MAEMKNQCYGEVWFIKITGDKGQERDLITLQSEFQILRHQGLNEISTEI